ncbi:endonuclease/exonuclease/phosphatase family protein [Dietzia psychralcaliphila]|uniref:endonuclease/exonuclease/phosphatase family protein n=1 Tax=Dietzia psychralcaliphila TaxID=139021 RepID=UPI001C1E82F2|nr:endonuclease/exonuclease/phosphatase family protein [Dietzia psychralcaliphila]
MASHDPGAAPAAGPEPSSLIGQVTAPALHVMSWNIRRPVPALLARPADRWGRRAPGLRALLAAERPTVLGAQEVLGDQAAVVREALGPGYDLVGRGRGADGGGEASPIFYDSDRLELLHWEQAALSDHPTRAGSVSWGNVFPRVMVSATFRDRGTARIFLVVNTHLDPFSARSRLRSARAIGDLVSAAGIPAVVTGDLNAGPSGAAVRELLRDGTLADSWRSARTHVSEEWGTYADYRGPRRSGSRIDWILASSAFRVTHAAVNPLRPGGGWASDHLPVHAVVELVEGGSDT